MDVLDTITGSLFQLNTEQGINYLDMNWCVDDDINEITHNKVMYIVIHRTPSEYGYYGYSRCISKQQYPEYQKQQEDEKFTKCVYDLRGHQVEYVVQNGEKKHISEFKTSIDIRTVQLLDRFSKPMTVLTQ